MSLDLWLEFAVDYGGPGGPETTTIFETNMTHNLTGLWSFIKVYDALYMSDKELAGEHLGALEVGLDFMIEHEKECREFDAPNGWGTYDQALPWLQSVVEAFRRFPKATIRVSK